MDAIMIAAIDPAEAGRAGADATTPKLRGRGATPPQVEPEPPGIGLGVTSAPVFAATIAPEAPTTPAAPDFETVLRRGAAPVAVSAPQPRATPVALPSGGIAAEPRGIPTPILRNATPPPATEGQHTDRRASSVSSDPPQPTIPDPKVVSPNSPLPALRVPRHGPQAEAQAQPQRPTPPAASAPHDTQVTPVKAADVERATPVPNQSASTPDVAAPPSPRATDAPIDRPEQIVRPLVASDAGIDPPPPIPVASSTTDSIAMAPPAHGLAVEAPHSAPAQAAAPGAPAMPSPAQIPTQVAMAIEAVAASRDENRIEIALDPPELGRVSIELRLSPAGVEAVVSAERSEVLELMRRHGDALRDALAEGRGGGVDLSFAENGRRDGSGAGHPALASPEAAVITDAAAERALPPPQPPGQRDRLDRRL